MHSFVEWRDALNLAPNVRAVEAIMRDYVEAIEPVQAVLPDECRRALALPLDVQCAAVTLMLAELGWRGDPEEHGVLHEVAHTFAAAAVRMAQLHGAPLPAQVESRNSLAAGSGAADR